MESDTAFMAVRSVLALLFVLGLMGALVLLYKRVRGLDTGLPLLKGSGVSRLRVVQSVPIDVRHRLALVRCDGTEHLLVLGGDRPVVLESHAAKEDISS